MSWLFLLSLMMISAYILLWMRMRRARTLLSGLPSFPELPLLGNVRQMLGDARTLFCFLNEASERANAARKPFVAWLPGNSFLFLSDPDDVRTITSCFIEKPYYYKFGKAWLGDGLVTASSEMWKKTIKKLGGTFNAPVVEDYQMMFNAQGQKLVDKLKEKVGAEPFDAMDILAYTTFETICQTALGVEDITCIVSQEYYETFNRCLELLLIRGLNLFKHFDYIYRLTRDYEEYRKCVGVLQNVSTTVLKNRITERRKIQDVEQIKDASERKFKPFIDILLDMAATDPHLSEEYIKCEMNTIIIGGQETTATTLYFALLMIGCEAEVQRKLYDEIRSIFGGTRRPVEPADLQSMRYCEAVVCETLRLYPPLPAVMRLADREIQLKSCTVPRGTMCCINAWGAGRSPHSWGPTASTFSPERWLDNTTHDSAAFLPFSYGRRSCIGKKYAISVLKTLLAYCVRELEFTSEAHKLDFKLDIALRPISGHLMHVTLRK